jgi:alpha-1,3-rhamnosyl/mannosyltransferase
MPILFDARVIQDHFPGIGRYAYHLLRHLPNALNDEDTLHVLYDTQAKNTRYPLPIESYSENIQWHISNTPIFGWRNLAMPLPTMMKSNSKNVAHFAYYLRPLRTQCPSITTIHDAISFVYPHFVPSAKARWVIHLTHTIAIRSSAVIIAVSQSAARDIVRFFPYAKDKIVTILEAADDFTPALPDQITATRAKYQLPPTFALYLASNKPHKNLERLVEAWHILCSQHTTLNTQQLVIAGHQDPRFPQAQQLATKLGIVDQIKFIGAVSNTDMAALYSACDLFVFPSLYEGFGLTPLEAMACGAPVACSNTSSLPEVVGDAALLFNPNQPQEIADACHRILSDRYLQLNLKMRSRDQAAKFTWAKTASATYEVYRSLM